MKFFSHATVTTKWEHSSFFSPHFFDTDSSNKLHYYSFRMYSSLILLYLANLVISAPLLASSGASTGAAPKGGEKVKHDWKNDLRRELAFGQACQLRSVETRCEPKGRCVDVAGFFSYPRFQCVKRHGDLNEPCGGSRGQPFHCKKGLTCKRKKWYNWQKYCLS